MKYINRPFLNTKIYTRNLTMNRVTLKNLQAFSHRFHYPKVQVEIVYTTWSDNEKN